MKNLKDMTAKELMTLAKELEIAGRWNMNKTQLIEAIEKATPEITEPEVKVNTSIEEENVPEAKIDEPETKHKKNKKRLIEYNGKTQTLTAWAREFGVRHQTFYNRIVLKGMDPAEAFEMPIRKAKKHD